MDNEYTFWRVFKAQWSFKNDLPLVCVMFFVNSVLVYFTTKGVTLVLCLYLSSVMTLLISSTYHILKGVAMALYCYSLIYYIKNNTGMEDLNTYIDYYNIALTWRK